MPVWWAYSPVSRDARVGQQRARAEIDDFRAPADFGEHLTFGANRGDTSAEGGDSLNHGVARVHGAHAPRNEDATQTTRIRRRECFAASQCQRRAACGEATQNISTR